MWYPYCIGLQSASVHALPHWTTAIPLAPPSIQLCFPPFFSPAAPLSFLFTAAQRSSAMHEDDREPSLKRRRVDGDTHTETEGGKVGEAAVAVSSAEGAGYEAAVPLFHSGVRVDYHANPPDFAALAQEDLTFAAALRSTDHGSQRRRRTGGRRTEADEERAAAASQSASPPVLLSTSSSSSSSSCGSVCVDWKDAGAVLAVTRALLLRDFGLSFELPLRHLCPPLPQRLSYLYFVADLMEEDAGQRHRGRRGVDVGCGASAVFPLLGARGFGYSFIATGRPHTPQHSTAQHSAACTSYSRTTHTPCAALTCCRCCAAVLCSHRGGPVCGVGGSGECVCQPPAAARGGAAGGRARPTPHGRTAALGTLRLPHVCTHTTWAALQFVTALRACCSCCCSL